MRLFFLKWIPLSLFLLSFSAQANNKLVFLGSFSKLGFTEEHYYIYQLDLWHEGDNLFGLYSFNAAMQGDGVKGGPQWRVTGSLKEMAVQLNGEQIRFSFTGNYSEGSISGRWLDSMTSGRELVLTKLPATDTSPAILNAPLASYKTWAHWVEQYLDNKDAADPQISIHFSNCSAGDGNACVFAGNHLKLRGSSEKAQKYYEAGCTLNSPTACRFIGQLDKAKEILKLLCTGQATMQNNFSCKELGTLAEASGNRLEAKEWYRKGCNDSIPHVCPDFNRLNAQ